jgi:hypothetical protein
LEQFGTQAMAQGAYDAPDVRQLARVAHHRIDHLWRLDCQMPRNKKRQHRCWWTIKMPQPAEVTSNVLNSDFFAPNQTYTLKTILRVRLYLISFSTPNQ